MKPWLRSTTTALIIAAVASCAPRTTNRHPEFHPQVTETDLKGLGYPQFLAAAAEPVLDQTSDPDSYRMLREPAFGVPTLIRISCGPQPELFAYAFGGPSGMHVTSRIRKNLDATTCFHLSTMTVAAFDAYADDVPEAMDGVVYLFEIKRAGRVSYAIHSNPELESRHDGHGPVILAAQALARAAGFAAEDE